MTEFEKKFLEAKQKAVSVKDVIDAILKEYDAELIALDGEIQIVIGREYFSLNEIGV